MFLRVYCFLFIYLFIAHQQGAEAFNLLWYRKFRLKSKILNFALATLSTKRNILIAIICCHSIHFLLFSFFYIFIVFISNQICFLTGEILFDIITRSVVSFYSKILC